MRLDTPEPPKSFTAHFDLQGSPQQGALELSTPLGTLLARLQWEPDKAWLQTPQEQREGTSVDELVQTLLGAPLPLDALFDWLDGVPTTASGWNLELGENQIRAQRHTPTPTVTLRILLTP